MDGLHCGISCNQLSAILIIVVLFNLKSLPFLPVPYLLPTTPNKTRVARKPSRYHKNDPFITTFTGYMSTDDVDDDGDCTLNVIHSFISGHVHCGRTVFSCRTTVCTACLVVLLNLYGSPLVQGGNTWVNSAAFFVSTALPLLLYFYNYRNCSTLSLANLFKTPSTHSL